MQAVRFKGPHITVSQLAEVFGWDAQKTRRWLKSTGAGEKRGKLFVTTPEKLRCHWPEAYSELRLSGLGEM